MIKAATAHSHIEQSSASDQNTKARSCPEIMTFPGDGRIQGVFKKKKKKGRRKRRGAIVCFSRTNTTKFLSCTGLETR